MITIPTSDLCGLLTDVAPFAFPDDDLPDVNVVRVEWDGNMLHASATDTMRAARSSWHPSDSDDNDTMFAVYGGADDRWSLLVDLAEAKEIAKVFSLPKKEGATPLTLTYDNGRLVIARNRDTGHTAHTMVVEGRLVNFPNLGGMLDTAIQPVATGVVDYSGALLAPFGLVRQRGGLLRMTFGAQRTRITIGDRFVGTIQPQPTGQRDVEPTLAGVA